MNFLKKNLSLILSVAMLFSLCITSFADYEPTEDEYKTIFHLEINGVPFNFNDEYAVNYFWYEGVPFTPVMQKLGYTVEYNEIFNYVSAKNGNSEFIVENDEVYSVKEGEKTLIPNCYSNTEWGITLVDESFFREALHYYTYTYYDYESRIGTLSLTDLTMHTEQMARITSKLISKYEEIGIDYHNISQQFTSLYDFSFESKVFGTKVTSQVTSDGSIKIKDNKLNFVYTLKTDGLSNIFDVILKIAENGGWNFGNTKNIEFSDEDFEKPITFEAYADSDGMLIKSEFFKNIIASYYLTDEEREKLKDKWLEVPQSEYINTFSTSFNYKDALSKPETYEDFLSSILSKMDTNKKIEALKLIVETYDDILNNCLTIRQEDNKHIIEFKMDKAKLAKILVKFAGTIPLSNYRRVEVDEAYYQNQVDSLQKLFDLLNLNITSYATVENGIIKEISSNSDFVLKNIPNPYKIPIGEIKINASLKSDYNNLDNINLERPELKDIVSQEELESMDIY